MCWSFSYTVTSPQRPSVPLCTMHMPVLSPPSPHREAGKQAKRSEEGCSRSRRLLPEPSPPNVPRYPPGNVLPPGGAPRRGRGSSSEPQPLGAHPVHGDPQEAPQVEGIPDSLRPRRAGANGRAGREGLNGEEGNGGPTRLPVLTPGDPPDPFSP